MEKGYVDCKSVDIPLLGLGGNRSIFVFMVHSSVGPRRGHPSS